MNWPYISGSNYGPEISFGTSSQSFLASPCPLNANSAFLHPNLSSNFNTQTDSSEQRPNTRGLYSSRLYSATQGYNGRIVIPKDKRCQAQTIKIPHGGRAGGINYNYAAEQLYGIPLEIGSSEDWKSRLLNNDDYYDPSIVNLMDTTTVECNSQYTNPDDSGTSQNGTKHDPETMIAYVTGSEKTNVAVSLVSNQIIKSSEATQSKPYSLVPDLGPAYVYHSETPITQLNFTKYYNSSIRNACLIRSTNHVEIVNPSYYYDTIDSHQSLLRPCFSPLYSLDLVPTHSSAALFSETLSHVSLNPDFNKLAAIESRGSLSLYNLSTEDGHYVKSQTVNTNNNSSYYQRLDPFASGASHSPWHRVFWTDNNTTLFIANRRGVSLYDTRQHKYSAPDSFFNFNNNRIGSSFLSDLVQSPANQHQFFGVVESYLIWLDSRYPKQPILSFQHHLYSDDPSIKIDVAVMEKESTPRSISGAEESVTRLDGDTDGLAIRDQMMLTLTSQLSPAALVYNVGMHESGLPFSLQDMYTYNLHPEYNTLAIRTIPTQLHRSLSSKPDSNEPGPDNNSDQGNGDNNNKTVCTVFQQSRDFGIVQHVLSSDPTDTLNLSRKYNPSFIANDGAQQKIEYHGSLLRLTRGLAQDSDESNAEKAGADIRDFRPFARLVCDLKKQGLGYDGDDELASSESQDLQDIANTIIKKVKYLLTKHERGAFSLVNLVNRNKHLNKDVATDMSQIIDQIKDTFGKKVVCKSRIGRMRSLLYNSQVSSIKDLEKLLSKLWIDPLKGAAVSLPMLKIIQQQKQRRKIERRKIRHRRQKVNIKTNFGAIRRVIRVPKNATQRRTSLTSRCLTYKLPAYYHNLPFVERRREIIGTILADIVLSHVTVSTRKKQSAATGTVADKFADKDLGYLRTFTDKFDRIGLSRSTKEALEIWKIKDGAIIQPPSNSILLETGGSSLQTKSLQSSKKKKSSKKGSTGQSQSQAYSQSFSQSYSQSYSQSQGFMGSQPQSSQHKKKKRKIKEGFV